MAVTHGEAQKHFDEEEKEPNGIRPQFISLLCLSASKTTVLVVNIQVYVPHEYQRMSTRALRRLKGKQRGQEALDLGDLTLGDTPEEQVEAEAEAEEEQLDTANVSPSNKKSDGRKPKKSKAQKNFSNIYELVR